MSTKREGTKLIDMADIPGRISRKQEQWIRLLKGIPKGKALVGTEQDFGKRAGIGELVKKYTERKLIPKGFGVTSRTIHGTVYIYIYREADAGQETKEAE